MNENDQELRNMLAQMYEYMILGIELVHTIYNHKFDNDISIERICKCAIICKDHNIPNYTTTKEIETWFERHSIFRHTETWRAANSIPVYISHTQAIEIVKKYWDRRIK